MPYTPGPYDSWSREKLIQRLNLLDPRKLHYPSPQSSKEFSFSSHTRRKIALKFCYSGWEYGGLAYQSKPGSLPTVEGVLFEALAKARLIDPDAGFEGCGWEKCGRTDRGVSAAGQVISLWVRSALPAEDLGLGSSKNGASIPEVLAPSPSSSPPTSAPSTSIDSYHDPEQILPVDFDALEIDDRNFVDTSLRTTKQKSEHDYLSILNHILPPTIRIIAWSPVSPTFSARFTCYYRHYKYFFTSSDGLSIPLMQNASSRLIGEHDFRNLCKVDAQKQITIFKRTIMNAYIEPVNPDGAGDMYAFNLIGSAFLYHQVRHIMAVLFLVGSGLEPPSIVSTLLNVEDGLETPGEGESTYEVVDRKPEYQMADALPLMLWECGYPESEVNWQATSITTMASSGRELTHELQSIYTRSQIYKTLNAHFLSAATTHHPSPTPIFPISETQLPFLETMLGGETMKIPLGGGTFKRLLRYTPVLKRNRLDTVDQINERWRSGKGLRRNEKKKSVDGEEDGDGDGDE